MHLTLPQKISQNISRAQSLMRRNEVARALETMIQALEAFDPANTVSKARTVAEFGVKEFLNDLNSNATVKTLLASITNSSTATVTYAPGGEEKFCTVLRLLLKAHLETESIKADALAEESLRDKEVRFAKAEAAIKAGERPRGRGLLRKLSEEFASHEDTQMRIATIFKNANLLYDAVEYLERACELFPRDVVCLGELVNLYRMLHEYEKAEKLYLAALKDFGRHPRTLINLGKLYLDWNKRDKAFDVLNDARRLAPDDEEIASLLVRAER